MPADECMGYALVDLSLYLVHLLNIYAPNKALIANLFATNVQTDALGRENEAAAIKSIAKVVLKALGRTRDFVPAESRAADIIQLVREDLAAGSRKAAVAGIDFERHCEQLLKVSGFEVQTTPQSGDYGADLVARKDDLGYAVQCKDTSKPVGIKAVQEAIGARRHYHTDFAVVCCSGGFTDAAVELATSNRVVLCNADQLVRRLEERWLGLSEQARGFG